MFLKTVGVVFGTRMLIELGVESNGINTKLKLREDKTRFSSDEEIDVISNNEAIKTAVSKEPPRNCTTPHNDSFIKDEHSDIVSPDPHILRLVPVTSFLTPKHNCLQYKVDARITENSMEEIPLSLRSPELPGLVSPNLRKLYLPRPPSINESIL